MKSAEKKDKFAQAWADAMTKKYSELSRRMPIFSDLQNIMDMTIVATLIVQVNRLQASGRAG